MVILPEPSDISEQNANNLHINGLVQHSLEEETAYDISAERNIQHPMGRYASTLNLVNGALRSGILDGYVAYTLSL